MRLLLLQWFSLLPGQKPRGVYKRRCIVARLLYSWERTFSLFFFPPLDTTQQIGLYHLTWLSRIVPILFLTFWCPFQKERKDRFLHLMAYSFCPFSCHPMTRQWKRDEAWCPANIPRQIFNCPSQSVWIFSVWAAASELSTRQAKFKIDELKQQLIINGARSSLSLLAVKHDL